MPQESVTFATSKEVKKALAENEAIFRYCHFETAELEGGDSDGVFLSCTFKGFEWYWGIFNLALFVGCKFERCTFAALRFLVAVLSSAHSLSVISCQTILVAYAVLPKPTSMAAPQQIAWDSMSCFRTKSPNMALNLAPFGRWTLRDKAAQLP